AADVVDIGAHAVAVAEHFPRQHLVTPDDGLATSEIDNDVPIFHALHNAVDDIADTILVFGILPVALGLAHLLHDDLLCRLRRDAAVFQRRQSVGNSVADLRRRVEPPRVFQTHLI